MSGKAEEDNGNDRIQLMAAVGTQGPKKAEAVMSSAPSDRKILMKFMSIISH